MALPELNTQGWLPIGLHAASLAQVAARFGAGPARARQADLLQQIVTAASQYETIKRVLLWGSFVSSKAEPNDLDYSLVVSAQHRLVSIVPEHRRFLVPFEARQFYDTDQGYLLAYDYPLGKYIERLAFMTQNREKDPCGIVEISLRGEAAYE